jgi:hypothetical protein
MAWIGNLDIFFICNPVNEVNYTNCWFYCCLAQKWHRNVARRCGPHVSRRCLPHSRLIKEAGRSTAATKKAPVVPERMMTQMVAMSFNRMLARLKMHSTSKAGLRPTHRMNWHASGCYPGLYRLLQRWGKDDKTSCRGVAAISKQRNTCTAC